VASDGPRYRRLVRGLLAASVAGSIGLALLAVTFGREFLRIAYAPDYGAYLSTFVLVALAAGFGLVNTVVYYALVAARRLGLLLVIQTVGLVIITAVGALLIPRYGLDGAALGAVLGAAIMAAMGARTLLAQGGAR
jgi:O-antigen/teichoic acid export membrane protein